MLEREQSKFMPKTKVAIEERFIIKFIENGGKFLYSENYNELNENLGLILKENNWTKDDVLITKNKIKSNYKLPNSIKINQTKSKCFISSVSCKEKSLPSFSVFHFLFISSGFSINLQSDEYPLNEIALQVFFLL